jgi:hypothetical protein
MFACRAAQDLSIMASPARADAVPDRQAVRDPVWVGVHLQQRPDLIRRRGKQIGALRGERGVVQLRRIAIETALEQRA